MSGLAIMYLVDTNVISEPMKTKPNAAVLAWLDAHGRASFVSAITIMELRYGMLRMAEGKRKRLLSDAIEEVTIGYGDAIIAFGPAEARLAANLHERAWRLGHTATIEDLMIAATALSTDLVLVTRNVKDFSYLGIETFNPFEQ